MKKFLFLFSLVAFVIMFSNCTSQKTTISNSPLIGTHWEVLKINGSEYKLPEGTIKKAYVILNPDNKAKGFLGCNSFGGGYTLSGTNSISFGAMFATRMICPDMKTEDDFNKALGTTKQYKIVGNKLYFLDEKGKELVEFVGK